MLKRSTLALLLIAAVATLVAASQRAGTARTASLEPPGRDQQAHIDGDTATLVNGRRVTPAGRVIRTQSYGWGLAVTRDGRRAALVHKNAVELIDLAPPYAVRRIPPYGSGDHPELGSGGYMGAAFSADGSRFYYGSADDGEILELDVASGFVRRRFRLDDAKYRDSFAGDLALGDDGRQMLVVDQFNYRMASIDVASGRVTRSVRVGRNPFAIALGPDGGTAWVSNVGMFEYPLVPGVTESTRAANGLDFPAYGVPSREARDGVTVNGRRIPGLGDPNAPEAMSVFGVNLRDGRVTAKLKTG